MPRDACLASCQLQDDRPYALQDAARQVLDARVACPGDQVAWPLGREMIAPSSSLSWKGVASALRSS